jgi:hypothetical protein
VFTWKGSLYMLPAAADYTSLQVYRADAPLEPFVLEAEVAHVGKAIDPTVVEWGSRFWLFCTDLGANGNPNDTLNIYWAETPLGPWHAHARNPVVRDIATARPAGMILQGKQGLVRPAQDCSRRYGGAVVFCEIDCLTPEDYRQHPIARISPGWSPGNLGTHTYNRCSSFEVVDGRWLTSERRWLDAGMRIAAALVDGPGVSDIRTRLAWRGQTGDNEG